MAVTESNSTGSENLSHDDKMAARARQENDTQSARASDATERDDKPQRPEHIPEKFWNDKEGKADVKALSEAYATLERKQSQSKPHDDSPAGKDKDKDSDKESQSKSADAWNTAVREYAEKGELSKEALTAVLEKTGLSKAQIDDYFTGIKARNDIATAKAYEAVGGEENFKRVTEWARANLDPAELSEYNAAVAKEDRSLGAVKGLYARYQLASGSEGVLSDTRAGQGSQAESPYNSQAEMTKAMSDPRYSNDPAYREEVARRLVATREAETIRF